MDNRVKVKADNVVREFDPRTTAKGQEIYPVTIKGTVDGKEGEYAVTAWGEKALAALKAGQELEASAREWKDKMEYTVFAPREQKSYGGGGFKRGGGSDDAIRRQCAYKGVVELICHGKLEMKQLRAALNEMDELLKPSSATSASESLGL